MHFGRDFGTKIDEKWIHKRCQKHVGIDLEVEPVKTQKLPPLAAFLVFFLLKLSPKSLKIEENSPRKVGSFFDQVFGSIFKGFGEDFGSVLGAKMTSKSINKNRCWNNYEKTMTTKMAKYGVRRFKGGRRSDVPGGGPPRAHFTWFPHIYIYIYNKKKIYIAYTWLWLHDANYESHLEALCIT